LKILCTGPVDYIVIRSAMPRRTWRLSRACSDMYIYMLYVPGQLVISIIFRLLLPMALDSPMKSPARALAILWLLTQMGTTELYGGGTTCTTWSANAVPKTGSIVIDDVQSSSSQHRGSTGSGMTMAARQRGQQRRRLLDETCSAIAANGKYHDRRHPVFEQPALRHPWQSLRFRAMSSSSLHYPFHKLIF